MEHAEVRVATLPVERWIEEYCEPDKFAGSCEACPDYGKVWSCPPGFPNVKKIFAPFSRVHIIGMKVVYKNETRAAATTPEKTDRLRAATYGKAKRIFLESLLEVEKSVPGSWVLAAGRCELCERCGRIDGLPCRMPERMRYSITGFDFDLVRIAHDLLKEELLWSPEGLPEYNVAIAALLERKGTASEQRRYFVEKSRPWKLFQEEVIGVLQRMGCSVRHQGSSSEQLSVIDQATGDAYELVFHLTDTQMALGSRSGSGRRLACFSEHLQECFPGLTPVPGRDGK